MGAFYSLYSSSDGNVSYVGTQRNGILIDAGVSCRKIEQGLRCHGIEPTAVNGILITHAHVDHVRGLKMFLKKYPVPVAMTEGTANVLVARGESVPDELLWRIDEQEKFQFKNQTEIQAFPTSHDAPGSVGYRLTLRDGETMAVCTDLGEVTEAVRNGVKGANLVLLESNYDMDMLSHGPYPLMLQKRVAGSEGHLSNIASSVFAGELVESGTTRLILGHLSPHNNLPKLAMDTHVQHLYRQGKVLGRDYLLYVASAQGLEQPIYF